MSNRISITTAASIGLGNVDNTSDADKPVSTAQQAALDLKANAADLDNVDNTSDADKPVSTATQTALDLKLDLAGGTMTGDIVLRGSKRVTADFTKTTDTTIATVTGLSLALTASKNYKFKAVLFINADATGGSKFRIGDLDTLTATNIIYEVTFLDDSSDAYVIAARGTALDTDFSDATSTAGCIIIEGLIEVNAAGTIGVGFAQSVSNGASSVLRGSTLTIEELA
jgi:hypothetical protein